MGFFWIEPCDCFSFCYSVKVWPGGLRFWEKSEHGKEWVHLIKDIRVCMNLITLFWEYVHRVAIILTGFWKLPIIHFTLGHALTLFSHKLNCIYFLYVLRIIQKVKRPLKFSFSTWDHQLKVIELIILVCLQEPRSFAREEWKQAQNVGTEKNHNLFI